MSIHGGISNANAEIQSLKEVNTYMKPDFKFLEPIGIAIVGCIILFIIILAGIIIGLLYLFGVL
jgi:flagellar biosynthesis component FlhA